MFSFGVVLYEMQTGRLPFRGEHEAAIVYSIVNEEPQALQLHRPDAPPELAHVITRLLEKNPDDRYEMIGEAVGELKHLQKKSSRGSKVVQPVAPPARIEATLTETTAPDQEQTQKVRASGFSPKKIGIITVAVVLLGFISYMLYRLLPHSEPQLEKPRSLQTMQITRVTTEGNVESVTVSPDGKYIAYSLEESGKRSLWAKHLGTGSRVEIVAAVEAYGMNASTFSYDGGYVYFTKVDEQNPQGALYQVPVLGGTSKKILANVSQPVSLSPDGKQFAFGRYHSTTTEDELLLANADGTNERQLVTVKEPDWLNGAKAAWSPDGKMLAVGYGSGTRGKPAGHIFAMTVNEPAIEAAKMFLFIPAMLNNKPVSVWVSVPFKFKVRDY